MNTSIADFQISSEYNRAIFVGKLDIRKARSCLHVIDQVTLAKGFSEVILDFTDLTFTHPPAMLMIISHVIRKASDGIEFQVALPRDETLSRLFVNSNWAHLIEPKRFDYSKFKRGNHLPTKRFTNAKEQADAVNEVAETLLTSLSGLTRNHLRAIEWSVNEITDNVLVHSDSGNGGLVQVMTQKTRKRVEFVVADAGIGVAQSLRAAHSSMESDVTALTKAIEEGVTRDKSLGQGNGLYGSYRIAVKSLGNFSVHANKATLYYADKAGLHSKKEQTDFKGSVVVCGIDYSNPLLLEEALKFGGTSHTPVDTIELKYETENEGEILFNLKQEADSLGSREAGRPIRQKLVSLWHVSNASRIVVDMSDIYLISSSFADEVFGKLFVEIGPVQFSSTFQLKSVDAMVRQIIDKAIMQRMLSPTA